MPADRIYSCNYPHCNKAFSKSCDVKRHKLTHCEYEERQFACPIARCKFRANQHAGLKCHMDSVHEKVRLPCGAPGCNKTFSDPSARCKHRKKHSGNTVIAASSTRPFESHGTPSEPSSSTLFGLPGGVHQANDVQTDGKSIDKTIQSRHPIAYNANPDAAQTAWAHRPPYPQQSPTVSHPPLQPGRCLRPRMAQEDFDGSQPGQSWDRHALSLTPLREDWMQVRSPPRLFSYPRTSGQVPSSAAYSRPNPRILFDM